jgi:uncharacterized protein (TIGR01777 family)
MKVAIVGGSGLIGRALTRSLLADGADVIVLTRDSVGRSADVPSGARLVEWSADDVPRLAASVAGLDAVVNLAGAPVAPWPWTARRKGLIRSSRVEAVRAIVDGMARLPTDRRPKTLVAVSGIDAYPESRGDDPQPMTEDHPMGTGFLAQVSRDVEEEARRAEAIDVRVVRLRMGHVLALDAKLVWYLALPVRLFVGGRIGTGRQWMSWVHIDDAVGLFRRALEDASVGGVLNVTSPGACRQLDFVRAMARVLRRPARLPAPAWLVRRVLGEQAVLLLGSRRVAPARARDELAYAFRYPSLHQAIDDVLG